MSDPVRGRRLLFVFNDAAFFISHRLTIAIAARDAGYEVHVAAPYLRSAFDRLEPEGFRMHTIPLDRSGRSPAADLVTMRALDHLYRHVTPDLVEHATIKPILYGSLVARRHPRLRVVNWVTGTGHVFVSRRLSARVLRKLVVAGYRLGLRSLRGITIFENPDNRALFSALSIVQPTSTVVIRGAGVDVDQFAAVPEPAGVPVVMLAARMLAAKGVREFVEAARRCRQAGLEARFVLVGACDPENVDAVPEIDLRRWNDEGAVEWSGPSTDMVGALRASTIFCLPSYGEGVPRVLLEAGATRRALIATDVAGCREVVEHGVTGLLVPPRDPAALAAAISRLIANPSERDRLAAAARARVVGEFSDGVVVAATLDAYARALAFPTSEDAHVGAGRTGRI